MMHLYTLMLFFLSNSMVSGLQGTSKSICFTRVREWERIVTGYEEYDEHASWTSVFKCCLSYSEVDGHCLPLCDPPCDHGECIDVNKCKCEKDYTGPSCSILICPPGNIGIDCKEDCPENTFGSNCEGKCSCKNGICDRVTGNCKCDSGWSGLDCSMACSQNITCFNGGICVNDSCDCPEGYIGEECEETCKEGYWGKNCSKPCDCNSNYYFDCEPSTGICTSKCQNGEYSDDVCWCDNGWTGEFCNEKECPLGYYGKDCNKHCRCQSDTTRHCDRITGECTCITGWIGNTCEEPCPYMTFGDGCNSTCECEDGNHHGCHQSTGECVCKRGWTGITCKRKCKCSNGYCDNYGNCICDPGWQGRSCDKQCDEGYYGKGCSSFCGFYANEGNIICDPISGPDCAAGWSGKNCMEACASDRYGRNCANICSCSSPTVCNRFTGDCECKPGWYGEECEKICLVGFYGLNCKHTCSCPNCRPTDGYCCQTNSHGGCDQYCPIGNFTKEDNACYQRKHSTGAANRPFSMSNLGFITVFTIIFLCY